MTKPPRRTDQPNVISNQNNHPFDNRDSSNRPRTANQFRRRQNTDGYNMQKPSPYGDLPQQQNIERPNSNTPYGNRDRNNERDRPANRGPNQSPYNTANRNANHTNRGPNHTDRDRGAARQNDRNGDRNTGRHTERSRPPARENNDNFSEQKSYNREDEQKIYGEHACMAAFKHRPDAIVRLYLNQETARRQGPMMSFLATQRKAYKVIKDDELARVAATQHHGGMVMVVKKTAAMTLDTFFEEVNDKEICCVLALDRVGNPHNVGAILRSAAHFGATHVLTSNSGVLANGSCARTAEGAAELIKIIECEQLDSALDTLKERGYSIIATSSHNGEDIYDVDFPAKSVLVLGEESNGISEEILANSDLKIKISGTGLIESLNVSVAAGLLLGEWWRQNGTYEPAANVE